MYTHNQKTRSNMHACPQTVAWHSDCGWRRSWCWGLRSIPWCLANSSLEPLYLRHFGLQLQMWYFYKCFTFMHELDIFKGPESDHPTSWWNPWSSSAEDQAQFLTCLATYPVQESLKSLWTNVLSSCTQTSYTWCTSGQQIEQKKKLRPFADFCARFADFLRSKHAWMMWNSFTAMHAAKVYAWHAWQISIFINYAWQISIFINYAWQI